MRKSNFTDKQRAAILEAHASGSSIEDLCRKHQISTATFYKWKKAHAEDQDAQKRRVKQLERENARFKKMYSELSMKYDILAEGYSLLKKM